MANKIYNHLDFEKKWSLFWLKNKTYKFNPLTKKRKVFYVLDMFPYPSGKGLHVGHPRGYTASDIIARQKRFKGYEVIHPIGWDAFGLPSEQYAIKTNNNPLNFTHKNIGNFRNQLISMGFSFDYDIEITTCNPDYYKWTQWIFQQMYKKKLATREKLKVNFCPKLNTVLANEETYIKNNKTYSLIGDFEVFQEYRMQWVLKIQKYAPRLISGLKSLDWFDNIKKIQKNWIGEVNGYNIDFFIENKKYVFFVESLEKLQTASVLFVTLEHPLINKEIIKKNKKFFDTYKNYQSIELLKNTNKGLDLKLQGINKKLDLKLPVYINCSLVSENEDFGSIGYKSKKYLSFFNTHNISIRTNNIDVKKNHFLKHTIYHLHNWVFSRQRFWGEPFPVYYNNRNELFLDKVLPVKLPEKFKLDENSVHSSKTPLEKIPNWYYININGEKYHRDSNVMPQWAGSCWYYIAYLWKSTELHYGKSLNIYDKKCKKVYSKFLPVDLYIGGKEHATSHLIYSRFWHKFLYDINIVDSKEPFQKLINQGMILGKNNKKMSKSLGNVVDPNYIIKKYGADTLRCYEMFVSDFIDDFAWDDNNLKAMRKWINKIYSIYFNMLNNKPITQELKKEFNKLLKGFDMDLKKEKFNTAISKMMQFINYCVKKQNFNYRIFEKFLILFSCYCPFVSEEIWLRVFGENQSIFTLGKWPRPFILSEKNISMNINIAFQINGRFKKMILVKKNISKNEIKNFLLTSNDFDKYFNNRKIINVFYKKNIFINFMIK